MTKSINSAVFVAIITLVGGIAAAVVTSIYQNEVSKREISLRTISLLAQDLLQEMPIILKPNPAKEELDGILRHKEMAFLAKGLTQHLEDNHDGMDFKMLRSALSSVERRYSYAQLYQAANAGSIICENIVMGLDDYAMQISDRLDKCRSSKLNGAVLSVSQIDLKNFRFKLEVANDNAGVFCSGKNNYCGFWIDSGDRLESTAYKHLVLAEYIGYEDVYEKKDPIVSLSIIERTHAVIDKPEKLISRVDNSYWTSVDLGDGKNKKDKGEDDNATQSCLPFFDEDTKTDHAPSKPLISDFGRGILQACGPLRGQVNEKEFVALMKDNWAEIESTLPSDWKSMPQEQALKMLKQNWLTYNGFNHIYCGEWQEGSIQGLHYAGRYLQLQKQNKACYKKSDDEEIEPDKIYTVGVSSADGANWHSKKGYALEQTALDLFTLGNKAFKYCTAQGHWTPYKRTFDNQFYVRNNEEEIDYKVICKATEPKNNASHGLLTIYPDKSPSGESVVFD